jgi:uncharacterized protein YfaP (DUF2135 family)
VRYLTRGACTALAMVSAMALYFHWTAAPAANLSAQAPEGGWNPAELQNEQVVKAARFALSEQTRQTQVAFKLLAIKHARQQMAQGAHYSMNLMVQSEGKRHLVIAVVWIKPNGGMELTRWHWV